MQDEENLNVEWYKSYQVQQALAQVGESNGSPEWLCDFLDALLVQSETAPEMMALAHEMAVLAATWTEQLERLGWVRGGVMQLDNRPLFRMCEVQPFDVVARYLRVTHDQLVAWMWPKSDPERLRVAAQAVADGMPITKVYAVYGVHWKVVGPYIEAHRIEQRATWADGRRMVGTSAKERLAELARQGLKAKAVFSALLEEGHDVKYDTVKKMLQRQAVTA